MLTLILILGIISLILGIYLLCNTSFESTGIALNVIGGVITGLALVGLIVVCVGACMHTTSIKKIPIYEEENVKLEQEIELTIKNYLKHEGKTFIELKSEGKGVITLIAAYPELASSKLVQSQIEIHQENSRQIKQLKSDEATLSIEKWLLYFGG